MNNDVAGVPGGRPEYRVALFGVSAQCQRMLEVVSRHAQHSPLGFRLAESRRADAFDIALVDMSVPGGPEVLKTLDTMVQGLRVVRLGRRNDPRRERDDVVHEQFARQIIAELNRAVNARSREADPRGAESSDAAAGAVAVPGAVVWGSGSMSDESKKATPDKDVVLPTGRAGSNPLGAAWRLLESAETRARSAGAAMLRADPIGPDSVAQFHPGVPSSRPCALIVDDSPTVRCQLSVALHQMGIQSEAVESADEAMRRLMLRRFDLVFADIVMPGGDGFQFTRELRRHPSLKKVPVIFLTSRSSPFDLVRAALAGCNSYLVKPVSLQSLRDTVGRQLRKSQQETRELRPGMLRLT